MSQNRVPLAVKIAKKVLGKQLVLKKRYDPKIVFADDFSDAISREIVNLKPETLGRIIAYGTGYLDWTVRASMRQGTVADPDLKNMSGLEYLKSGAMSVIRAAMMDIIEEYNSRLMQQIMREVHLEP